MSKATEEDVKEYMRCILGARPFTKSYTVCASLPCVLRTLTTKERLSLNRVMAWADEHPEISADTSDRANLYYREAEYMEKSPEEMAKFLATLYDDMSYELYTAKIQCLQDFIALVEELREKVLEDSFWKGAGQG